MTRRKRHEGHFKFVIITLELLPIYHWDHIRGGPTFDPVKSLKEVVTWSICMPIHFWSTRISFLKDHILRRLKSNKTWYKWFQISNLRLWLRGLAWTPSFDKAPELWWKIIKYLRDFEITIDVLLKTSSL